VATAARRLRALSAPAKARISPQAKAGRQALGVAGRQAALTTGTVGERPAWLTDLLTLEG